MDVSYSPTAAASRGAFSCVEIVTGGSAGFGVETSGRGRFELLEPSFCFGGVSPGRCVGPESPEESDSASAAAPLGAEELRGGDSMARKAHAGEVVAAMSERRSSRSKAPVRPDGPPPAAAASSSTSAQPAAAAAAASSTGPVTPEMLTGGVLRHLDTVSLVASSSSDDDPFIRYTPTDGDGGRNRGELGRKSGVGDRARGEGGRQLSGEESRGRRS